MGSDVDAIYEIWQTVLFHTSAAATGKARSPTVDSRDGGTTKAGVDAERVVNQIKNKFIDETVSDFFKSVNIWQSYNREHGYLVHFLPELGTRVRDSRLESVSSLCF